MAGSTTNYGATKPAVGEAYDINIHNNNSDIWDTQIKNRESQSLGLAIAPLLNTVSSGSVSALSVARNIASFTFKANRRYEIAWEAHVIGTVDADYVDLSIQTCLVTDASNLVTGLTMKRLITQRVFTTMNPFRLVAPVTYGADTTLQVKFCLVRTTGTGSITINASADRIDCINIYDLGKLV